MGNKKYFLIIFIISFSINNAFAVEPILITVSEDMDKIIFDGKWTYYTEWKKSSLNTISYNEADIKLRTAHQNDYIYIFVDFVTDTHLEKIADGAIICFDTSNDKSSLPDSNDYCFMATLGGKRSFTYQGGSPFATTSHLQKISNPDGFIAIGDVSDGNDRYSTIPHASYEFRIPTSFIGRSDVYGFYFGVYDAHFNRIYSYPEDIPTNNLLQVPNPNSWGELVSLDKSLPEFHIPFLVIFLGFILAVYITRKSNFLSKSKINY